MPSSTEAIILARVNQKMHVGSEAMPHGSAQEGNPAQTNALVSALLRNIAMYDAGARGDVEQALELAIPGLAKIGLFSLFSPEEWCSGTNPGRQFVGLKAKEYLAAHP